MREVRDVRFPSGDDDCAAWLYLPDTQIPAPVIVMGHGLGAIRQMRLDAYAERFSAAGYACLVFDYRHFGDSSGEPRQLLDIKQQLQDWAAAIAYARVHAELSDQVVLWGSSFGGGHVIEAAARDQHIAAVIAQCPFTNGIASSLALSIRSSVKTVVLASRDIVGSRFGKPPVMIALAGPPGSAALMTAPDAEPGYLALVPSDIQLRNEVAARFGLSIPWYRPGRNARKITSPVLFCVCESDSVAPPKPTLRYARQTPRGEIKLYPEGHFEIYVNEPFERVVSDQIAFLHKHVPPRQS